MTKRSPLQIEEDNLVNRKKIADQRWDELMERVAKGEMIEKGAISSAMSECNMADYGLMQRNLFAKWGK